MKKITFSLLLIIATISFSYSQSLKLIQAGGSSKNMKDTTLYGNSTNEMLFFMDLINMGAIKDTIRVASDTASAISGTSHYVCWAGYCTPVNNHTDTISPGDTAKLGLSFSAEYFPNGHIGTSTIEYIFLDLGRPAVRDTLTVHYITTPAGINQVSDGQIKFLVPYPNPANTNVNFNYSLTNGIEAANLKVFNLLGECVQALPVSASKTKAILNVQSMPAGIYICEMEAEGCQPIYQKLIISH